MVFGQSTNSVSRRVETENRSFYMYFTLINVHWAFVNMHSLLHIPPLNLELVLDGYPVNIT